MKWPLRDALLAYERQQYELATERWEHESLIWATLAAAGATKKKRPKAPVPPGRKGGDDAAEE